MLYRQPIISLYKTVYKFRLTNKRHIWFDFMHEHALILFIIIIIIYVYIMIIIIIYYYVYY